MKIADILALTGAKQRTIYSWMRKHPTLEAADASSPLGHPFPRPVGKEGRAVVWEEVAVRAWWKANEDYLGRHPEEGVSTTISDKAFLEAMRERVEDYAEVHSLAHIEAVQRIGPGEMRVTFRTVADAVHFKLRWGH